MEDTNDNNNGLSNTEKFSLLSDLTKRWERRHTFFWSSVFKVITLYSALIVAPWLLKADKMILLLLPVIIFLFVIYSIPKISKWLSLEENRQKIVLEQGREIYKELGYNISPSKSDDYDEKIGIYSMVSSVVTRFIVLLAFVSVVGNIIQNYKDIKEFLSKLLELFC